MSAPTTPPLRWRRIAAGDTVYFAVAALAEARLAELFSPAAELQLSPLGRGGGHFIDAELGPLRLKLYERGGLFGKLFPQYGLAEIAAQRELVAEQMLAATGLATQVTLALCVQPAAPRLRALQRYFPDETTYAEMNARHALTDLQRGRADALLEKIIAAGYYHGDANGGNLLWCDADARWRLIDLASARPLGGLSPARALAMMRARLAKPPRAYRK